MCRLVLAVAASSLHLRVGETAEHGAAVLGGEMGTPQLPCDTSTPPSRGAVTAPLPPGHPFCPHHHPAEDGAGAVDVPKLLLLLFGLFVLFGLIMPRKSL